MKQCLFIISISICILSLNACDEFFPVNKNECLVYCDYIVHDPIIITGSEKARLVCKCPNNIYESNVNGDHLSNVSGDVRGEKNGENDRTTFYSKELDDAASFFLYNYKLNEFEQLERNESPFTIEISETLRSHIKNAPIDSATNIGILDSRININAINAKIDGLLNRYEINFDYYLENSSEGECVNAQGIEDTRHGTAVVYKLLEKLILNGYDKSINIHVYNITNVKNDVTLSRVGCAIFNSIKNKDEYVNMSFGFKPKCNYVFESYITELVNKTFVEIITCAVGNDAQKIGSNEGCEENKQASVYPAAFSQSNYKENPEDPANPNYKDKIYEICGVVGNNLWRDRSDDQSDSDYGSNFFHKNKNRKLYAANPFLGDTIESGAGTSFAAPRILADIIYLHSINQDFGNSRITIENNIEVIPELNNVQAND